MLAEAHKQAILRKVNAELESRAAAQLELSSFVIRTSAQDYNLTPNHRDVCNRLQRFVERCRRREGPRLILVMPTQRGKSHISTQRATVWAMGWWPGARIGIAGYSQSIATFHSMRAQQIASSIEAISVWPKLGEEPPKDAPVHAYDMPSIDTQKEWTAGGSSFVAVGLGVGLSGRPLDILFVDDPHKGPEDYQSVANRDRNDEWLHGVGLRRLSPGGGVCFVSTPWGLDDLMERQKRRAKENPLADQYEVIRFPEIAEEDEYGMLGELLRREGEVLNPKMHTLEEALRTKATAPPWIWSTIFRCLPTSDAGDVVKREHTNNRHRFDFDAAQQVTWDEIWSSCDPTFGKSATSDLVSLQMWGRRGANRYILDRVTRRMSYTDLRQAYRDFHGRWKKCGAKLLEKTANGQALYDDLHNEIPGMILVPVPTRVVPEKFQTTAYLWQAGNVWLPEADIAPWVGEYIEVIVTVPAAPHDDDAAATAHALSHTIDAVPDAATHLQAMLRMRR